MTTKTLEQPGSNSQVSPTSTTQLAQLHIHSDSDIAADVRRVLQANTLLRATADRIDVRVSDGGVTLRGYVASDAHKARAENDARQIPGVQQIENHLIADPDLEARVAQQIAQDTHLRGESIFVHSTIGVIYLDGQADRAAVADTVERCAASVSNVRSVVNRIQFPGVANHKAAPVLLPGIGQAVYASDGWLGRVEQVVMNPRNRRVTAIVVSANFYSRDSKRERRILIPSTAVRNVNASGIELNFTVDEVDQSADFDPTKFVAADSHWQPPFDYAPSDILLSA